MSQYLSEAFKKLEFLNEDTFPVTEKGLKDFWREMLKFLFRYCIINTQKTINLRRS